MPKKKKKAKKKRFPRIAMHLARAPQELYTQCSGIWQSVKADPKHFGTTFPPSTQVDDDLKELGDALVVAESGAPADLDALEQAADKVRRTFTMLGKFTESVVHAGPVEEASSLISSVHMYESNVGARPPKPALALQDVLPSGSVRIDALALEGAASYYWEVSVDQVTWTEFARSAQAHATATGLTPGKVYYFRFRALLRREGMTDYSQVVNHLVR